MHPERHVILILPSSTWTVRIESAFMNLASPRHLLVLVPWDFLPKMVFSLTNDGSVSLDQTISISSRSLEGSGVLKSNLVAKRKEIGRECL
ncbi:hypothetical protein PoB_001717700 [Plakobranchus ocellatus]|uniref:Uncharacterized protein n=1 Tax=Plakobranchus ocellatus TaxID=259542 RepID=A0AAV3Z868_9GAST|nr:hypothetical protein PoB_001717700 [Plakobranchus ocellatus]